MLISSGVEMLKLLVFSSVLSDSRERLQVVFGLSVSVLMPLSSFRVSISYFKSKSIVVN